MKRSALAVMLVVCGSAAHAQAPGTKHYGGFEYSIDCGGETINATFEGWSMGAAELSHWQITFTDSAGQLVGQIVSSGPGFEEAVDGRSYYVFPGRNEFYVDGLVGFVSGRAVIEVQGKGDAMTFTLVSFTGRQYGFSALDGSICSILRL